MSGGIIVSGVATCPVDGLTVRTFAGGGVHRFPSKGKASSRGRARHPRDRHAQRRLDHRRLEERGLSVHLVMDVTGRSRSTEISRPTSCGTRASTTARRLASRS